MFSSSPVHVMTTHQYFCRALSVELDHWCIPLPDKVRNCSISQEGAELGGVLWGGSRLQRESRSHHTQPQLQLLHFPSPQTLAIELDSHESSQRLGFAVGTFDTTWLTLTMNMPVHSSVTGIHEAQESTFLGNLSCKDEILRRNHFPRRAETKKLPFQAWVTLNVFLVMKAAG